MALNPLKRRARLRRFSRRRRARHARRLALAALAAALVWLAGFFWFAQSLPTADADSDIHTQAIVVLTGGGGRLEAGLDLLAAGAAERLFVSGVYRGVDVVELLQSQRHSPEQVACCITLGYTATDTRGNAVETARWIAAQDLNSLRLVTAHYHMRRSLLEFRRALGDVTVIANPIVPPEMSGRPWWRTWRATRLLAIEYSKFLIASATAILRDLLPASSP
ncbi:MAG: YdcF family protein [Alphaproteobacteria bacterium]